MVKFTKKFLEAQIWGKQTKIGPKISFFAIFSCFLGQFYVKLQSIIALNNVYLLVEVKLSKTFCDPNFDKMCQNRSEIRFFGIFSSLLHQFSFKLHWLRAWNNSKLLVEVKNPGRKISGTKFGAEGPKSSPNQFFCYFSSLVRQFSFK